MSDWTIKPGDPGFRPGNGMVPDDACFYCHGKIFEQHKPECVIRTRTVKIRVVLEFDIERPGCWSDHDVEFHVSESSSCFDNVLRGLLEQREKDKSCTCSALQSVEVVHTTEGAPGSEK